MPVLTSLSGMIWTFGFSPAKAARKLMQSTNDEIALRSMLLIPHLKRQVRVPEISALVQNGVRLEPGVTGCDSAGAQASKQTALFAWPQRIKVAGIAFILPDRQAEEASRCIPRNKLNL